MNGLKSSQGGITVPAGVARTCVGAFGAVPAAPRYCAIGGSTAEIWVQPCRVILPSLGVTVWSELFGMWSG